MTAVGADGTRFTLTIPPGALLEPTTVTLTPIKRATGLPVCGGRFMGVDLAPEGLRLSQAATLDITPAKGRPAADALSFTSRSDGTEAHLYPLALKPGLALRVVRLSNHMVQMNIGPDGISLTEPAESLQPTEPESQLEHHVAGPVRAERKAPGGNDYYPDLLQVMRTYYDKVVQPMLARIETDCEFAKANVGMVTGFARQAAILLNEEDAAPMEGRIFGSVVDGLKNCFLKTAVPCLDRGSPKFFDAVNFARQLALLGVEEETYNPHSPRYVCTGVAAGKVTYTRTVNRTIRDTTVREEATLEVSASFRPEEGGFVNAGTSVAYDYAAEGRGGRGECVFTSDTRRSFSGPVRHASLRDLTFNPSAGFWKLDVGSFTQRGTTSVFSCGSGGTRKTTSQFSGLSLREGCSVRDPGAFSVGLQGFEEPGSKRINFDCSFSRTEKLGAMTVTTAVTVSGSIDLSG